MHLAKQSIIIKFHVVHFVIEQALYLRIIRFYDFLRFTVDWFDIKLYTYARFRNFKGLSFNHNADIGRLLPAIRSLIYNAKYKLQQNDRVTKDH